MMFHPRSVDVIPESTPDMESVRIRVTSGEEIHGLFFEHPEPQAVIIYCHGNAGNIVDRIPRLRMLRDRFSVSILGFDYRGYGASDGAPSEANMYQDARAARQWLAVRQQISPTDIVVMGRSLGGAVAVELAAREGAAGLILESTFTRMRDVGGHHFPWLPVSLMVSQEFDSIGRIRDYTGPLLQTHGSRDQVVPFELGNRLFEEAVQEEKLFVTTSGGHNDLPGPAYDARLREFLAGRSLRTQSVQRAGPEFDCQPAVELPTGE